MHTPPAPTLHCLCTDLPGPTPGTRRRGARRRCPREMRPQDVLLGPRWAVPGWRTACTRPAGPPSDRSVFGQTELENTKSRDSSVRKGTQSRGSSPVPEAEVTGSQRSLLPQEAAAAEAGRSLRLPRARPGRLLTSSRCWRWCWPRRPHPGHRGAGHSSRRGPPRHPASRGVLRFGQARAALRAAATDTTG